MCFMLSGFAKYSIIYYTIDKRYNLSMITRMSSSASIIVVTVVVPRVCVCLFVVFCRHVHLDSDVRVHGDTENSFIII